MIVYAATKNAGKLRELTAIFAPLGWRVRAFETYRDVVEGDASYRENAALKAVALREQLVEARIRAAVIADDSGLEIRALGGMPGIRSARYGPPGATWSERRKALLDETKDRERAARFVCALHFIASDGCETAVIARLEGAIAAHERGDGGFSYDAIFEYPAGGSTFAELSEAHKNAVSHRARAARALDDALSVSYEFNRGDRI